MPQEEQTYRESIDFKLRLILEQTTKTNGTVRWLTRMTYLTIGFCGCMAVIVLPLIWALITAGKL